MRKTGLFILALLFISAAVLIGGISTASASIPTDCASCHAKYPTDRFDGYSDANPVMGGVCLKCHADPWVVGQVSTAYGYFLSTESINFNNPATLATIHTKHKDTNAWSPSINCIGCHAGTSCTTCHTADVPHGTHTVLAGGTNNYPGAVETYAFGTYNPPYTFSAQLTCTNGSCHGSMNSTFVPRPSCANCHALDKTGHGDITAKHESTQTATGGCVANGCHTGSTLGAGSNLATEHAARIDPLTGQPYNCDTCHKNPDPARAAQIEPVIAANDTRCSSCHGATGASGHTAQHEANPSLEDTTTYPADSCEGCHLNNMMTEHARRKARDGTYLTCDSCHQDPAALSVITAKSLTSAADTTCKDCHTIHGSLIAIHESPTTQPGNTIGDLECNDCHAANLGTEHDKYNKGCSTCHDSVNPTVLGAIDDRDTTCNTACHTSYHTSRDASHTAISPASVSDCGTCHDKDPAAGVNVEGVHANAPAGKCAVCHSATSRVAPLGTKTAECASCHAFAVTDHPRTGASHVFTELDDRCVGCHSKDNASTNTLVEGHAKYAADYRLANACVVCHANATKGDITAGKTPNCFSCHGDTGPAVSFRSRHTYWANTHRAQNTTCFGTKCHVEQLKDNHSRSCTACHRVDYSIAGKVGTNCLGCHANSSDHKWTGTVPEQHTTTTDLTGCTGGNCHTSTNLWGEHSPRTPSAGGSFMCSTCHGSTETSVVAAISQGNRACFDCHVGHGDLGVKHTATASQACVSCHETGDVRSLHPSCATCHSSSVAGKTAECVSCHGAKSPPDPNHYNETTHTATPPSPDPDGGSCSNCHSLEMKPEHAKASSGPVSCVTCHETKVDSLGTPWNKTCAACHVTQHEQRAQKHKSTSTCVMCHGDNLENVHTRLACTTCHNNPSRVGDVFSKTAACESCHYEPLYPYHAQQDVKHTAAFGTGNCGTCHATLLPTEHEKPTSRTSTGEPITCATCHVGALSPVSQVKPWDKTCTACHPTAGSHTAQHESGLDAQCQICHKTNLIDTHADENVQCAGCHEYTTGSLNPQDVTSAIAGGNKNCDACHKTLHEDLQPGTNSSYHPVFQVGTNPMTGWNSWVSPWTATSITKCTDCHAASSSYPVTANDGSTVYLVAPYPTTMKDSGSRPSNMLCFKCHSANVYGSNAGSSSSGFGKYHESEHGKYNCRACHSVHGSSNRRLVSYNTDTATGKKWLAMWTQNTGAYSKDNCYSLHGECDHHANLGTQPATITGKVTDGGTGAAIKNAKLIGNKYDLVGYTDSAGNYRLPNLYYGIYTITVSAGGYPNKSKTVTVSEGQTATLDFILGQPGTIRGKVTAATDGAVISGAIVKTDVGGYTATTASDGTYEMGNVELGTYAVTASKAGYQDKTQSNVVVGSGQTVTVDLALAVQTAPTNLALGRPSIAYTASGYESNYQPYRAFDGTVSSSSRWWKKSISTHWLKVDLGASYSIRQFVIKWHSYYAKRFRVEVSTDNSSWTKVYETSSGGGGTTSQTFSAKTARYVRVYCTEARDSNGYSIYEFEVYQ